MVGIVIVSHSNKVAEGIKELAGQMAADVPMVAAGGTSDGRLGTDVEKIMNAIQEVYSEDGVVILFDLGSAYMNSEMAIECLPEDMQKNIEIVDTALVEGAVSAAVESSINGTLESVKQSVAAMSLGKMP
ncbi:dihydroxyacetone kinase phosphoryl donor subunit DhaM [Clostridium ganghwense]|uniref:phosphoenolpyruvate--glycerone phosphotransferase n=1 Tax=Clostridium ganghwense TaxID=312089 RepID=A0ABT4CP59_9CLOT|nr:dihydroxyacetone kinase phosphoryl donor subunit DhaM [Clostridium ganghwense]MCY6370832.1 dihydroxyacetone kinase phosphoryl donor subunit DhaM [Clostridium ganghwense]